MTSNPYKEHPQYGLCGRGTVSTDRRPPSRVRFWTGLDLYYFKASKPAKVLESCSRSLRANCNAFRDRLTTTDARRRLTAAHADYATFVLTPCITRSDPLALAIQRRLVVELYIGMCCRTVSLRLYTLDSSYLPIPFEYIFDAPSLSIICLRSILHKIRGATMQYEGRWVA